MLFRVAAFACALMLVIPELATDIIGISLFVLIVVVQFIQRKKVKLATI